MVAWVEQDTAWSIGERFAQQVARDPTRVALESGGSSTTYEELASLAARAAQALLDGRGAVSRVALLLDHDDALVAGALGALSCGAAIVTLNPADPPARIAAICAQVRPDAVLVGPGHLERARAARIDDGSLVDASSLAGTGAASLPGRHVDPDAPAFLISTSGSTGEPKIVVQTHRNVLHNVLRYTNGLGIRPDDRFALLAALSGGQGLATTWTALLNGCTLLPFPIAARGVTGLADWLEESGVTIFDTIPSVLRTFALALRGRSVGGVRIVRLASEAAVRGDFDAFREHFAADCVLASVLASSECGIVAQMLLTGDDDVIGERVPVGRPADGITVMLLGDDGVPAADGDVGEIIVESRYLSPGYLGDERLTAERFETAGGLRRFRSGDRARRAADGVLTVVGRVDAQVKVRGHRLQLEDVEAALSAQPGVGAAAVLVHTTPRGDAVLVAFVTPATGVSPDPPSLRRALRRRLPPHAVPAAFHLVDSLPLTAHGKTDRTRLAELWLELGRAAGATPAAGRAVGETEELLAALWADALERADVGREEPFLDLGGDSLDAATIAAGVEDLFGVHLELRLFTGNPTVASMAASIDRARGAAGEERVELERAARPGILSSSQMRFWRQERVSGSPTRWNVVVPFELRGPLDLDALRRSLELLIDRHEILRTSYREQDGHIAAHVGETAQVELVVDDLADDPRREARISELIELERLRPYTLGEGPLHRWRLIRLGEQEHRLLRSSHHMIHDAETWTIFFDELAIVYEALLDGRPSPLGGPPARQYIDYAAWEQASLNDGCGSFEAEVDWWQARVGDVLEPVRLPFARPEADDAADRSDDVIRWGIPQGESAVLDEVARSVGATYFMTRLTAFAAYLALETGVDGLQIGTPVNMRTRAELQTMLGPFINFRPLRLRIAREQTFEEALRLVRREVLDVSAHARFPWEAIARELGRRGLQPPVVTASFSSWSSVGSMRFGGIELEPLPRPCGESRGFRVGVARAYEASRCWADFDPCVFDRVGVAEFVQGLRQFVAGICAAPARAIADVHAAACRTSRQPN